LPASVLILPKRYAITPIALPGNRSYQSDGVALASSVGDSEEFRALRDYRPGDSPRKIHWKSWAKVGKPIFKEEQDEFFVRHALILDTFLPIAPAKNLNPNLYFVAMVSGVLLSSGDGSNLFHVTGYSVHQFSPWEGQYIVRSRDAHAWTLAYVDGTWRTLDTTPPDWTAQEAASASPFQILTDAWSLLQFKLAMELRQLTPQSLVRIALWAIAPFGGFLVWRLRRAKFKRRSFKSGLVGRISGPSVNTNSVG
jgi:hypothetical protein